MPRPVVAGYPFATKVPRSLLNTKYVCPTCAISQLRQHARRAATREASTLVSATAVNARKQIPSHLKRLHASLERLRHRAGNYVDLSRLQLALQGLESSRPKIRIAVLGLETQRAARQVARLLAADPLEPKGRWEDLLSLDDLRDADPRSILLRFGHEDDRTPSSPLVNVLSIPSPFLRSNNLEILIASLETPTSISQQQSGLAEAALVPLIGIPTSSTGGVSLVRHPVHRALVIGEGLNGCEAIGRWSLQRDLAKDESQVQTALNLPGYTPGDSSDFVIVDLPEASGGLDLFRESIANGGLYGSKWGKSGLSQLVEWIGTNRGTQTTGLIPAVRSLVTDLISQADSKLLAERSRATRRIPDISQASDQMKKLEDAVGKWASSSHAELRDLLEHAFRSEEWARLKWFKLLWRVDDVEMILSRILERFWLVDTEKRMIWLSGRATEAGLLPAEAALALLTPADESSSAEKASASEPATTQQSAVLPSSSSQIRHRSTPKYTGIEEERRWLKQTTIPEIQSQAQGLIIQTLSFSGLSGGLSALVYVAWPAMGLYGAGAFAALGVVWALRRLQTQWESGRAKWELELQRQGQRVLQASEDNLRALITRGPARARVAPEEDIEQAQAALQDAQAALDEVLGAKEAAR